MDFMISKALSRKFVKKFRPLKNMAGIMRFGLQRRLNI